MSAQSKRNIKSKTSKTLSKVKVNVRISRGNVVPVVFVKKPLVVTAKAKGFDRITIAPDPNGGFVGHTRNSGTWTGKTPAKAFARTMKNAWV